VNGLAGTVADTIEEFRFVDAATGAVTTTLTLAQVAERLLLDARTDGNDQILGSGSADVMGGGAGADVLDGLGGNDTYEFRRGDGDDRIDDTGDTTGDTLRLPDFDPTDLVSVRRSPPAGLDLVLSFDSGDRVVLAHSLSDGAEGVENIVFADGSTWTADTLRQRVIDDAATAGDESIWGFAGGDTMAGGHGDDHLHGGDGSDTYHFARGDDQDTIEDDGNGDVDRVEIAGYTSAQASVARFYKGDDGIVLRFAGSDDTLTILNTLDGDAQDGIEQIAFADGVVWKIGRAHV
jgi:Ca2+-binding RTX toxin-like protein